MNSAQPDPKTPVAPSSGAHELIGYHVDLSAGDGSARVVLDIEPKHLNRNGSLHGGIIAMMLDASAGFAASLSGNSTELVPVVTVALNAQYLASATGGRVVATGFPKGGGRSITYADAQLRDDAGKLLASGNGVFKFLRRKPEE